MKALLDGDEYSAIFVRQLLGVGTGNVDGGCDGVIRVQFDNFVSTVDDLIATVFPEINAQ